MIDKNIKDLIFNNGYYDLYVCWRRKCLSNFGCCLSFYHMKGVEDLQDLHKNFQIMYNWFCSIKAFHDNELYYLTYCEKLFKSTMEKKSRLEKRIKKLFSKECLFLTLTFDEIFLANSTDTNRRKYISKFLRSFGVPYVANIDFGEKNGREHYHAIIQLPYINPKLYSYGNLDIEKIVCSGASATKLSKYITKISNHSFKDSVKHNSLIYSKDFNKL